MEKRDFGLIHDATELRALIAENPDLPIVVIAGEEASCGEYAWTYCTDVWCRVDAILDVNTPYDDDEHIFTDEFEFEEKISEVLYDEYGDKMTDQEIEKMVKAELEKYEPHWRKVIAIYATN